MRTFDLNGKSIRVYDSIDEMPIVNFQKYNKYLLIDSGIGSDANDIDAHIVNIAKYIKANDSKNALQELQNMRQNIYMVNSGISPKYLAFAALIHDIDGKIVTDLSDDNLKAIIDNLNDTKHSTILNYLFELKKKVSSELEIYFPGDFISTKEKETYDKIKNRTCLVLDSIINDSDNTEQIKLIDDSLEKMHLPNIFIGSDSVEVKYDKQFESMCILIAQKTSVDARKMTVLQFYTAIDNIKQQIEAESKSLKKFKKA